MNKDEFSDWLFSKGRFYPDFTSFISACCDTLVEMGIPVSRVNISFRTLHPQMLAWACVWGKESETQLLEIPKEAVHSEDYIGGPIEYVVNNKKEFRQSLISIPKQAHSFFHDLKRQGLTDYFACPIILSNAPFGVATFTTDDTHGFCEKTITDLSQITNLISPFIEILATRRLALNILETYIGPRTGNRILDGQIQRGDGENITAALWFSDFRNFTHYTETFTLEQMLETLNQYFEIVHDCVENHGGEILRFIGDAMLIVFPVDDSNTLKQACQNALSSAIAAQKSTQAINLQRSDQGKPIIEFGVGLHEGSVMYGNVGAPTRLDFTVMGVAVNRTARLESLTKELNCPLLVSGEFIKQIQTIGVYEGQFPVKGVKSLLEVYSIPVNS